MSLPKNVREWYQSFLFKAKEMGIDIHSPESAKAFRFTRNLVDGIGIPENTKAIGQMDEEQITKFFELAKDGSIIYQCISDALGAPCNEQRILYTDENGLPCFSDAYGTAPLPDDIILPNPNEDAAEAAFKGVQAHETVYGGVRVNVPRKEELSNQPCAEFLRFEQRKDGSYTMNYKLPEKGRKDGRDFNIRENMNYLMRGMARKSIDKNGDINLAGFDKFLDNFLELEESGVGKPGFADYCGVPKDKQADFCRCMKSIYMFIDMNVMSQLDVMLDSMVMMQHSMNELYKPGQPVDKVKEKFLMESYPDFLNMLDSFRKMAVMDPEKETNVYFPMDCGSSASMNRGLLSQVNNYRENRGLPLIPVPKTEYVDDTLHYGTKDGKLDINFDKDAPDNPEAGSYRAFEKHSCLTLNAELDNKKVLVSMETTAPKAGKLLFYSNKGETATGIYNDNRDLIAFHTGNNRVHVDNMKTSEELKNIKVKNIPRDIKLRGSHILEMKIRTNAARTGHTMEELGKRLSSKKLDNPFIKSSSQFKAIKTCFEQLAKVGTPEQERANLANLNMAAQIYLDYKDPKGDLVKKAGLSTYAKDRIKLAKDILEYTSAMLHQNGIRPKVFSELKSLGKYEEFKAQSEAKEAFQKARRAENSNNAGRRHRGPSGLG